MDFSPIQLGKSLGFILVAMLICGCSSTTPRWVDQPWTPVAGTVPPVSTGMPMSNQVAQPSPAKLPGTAVLSTQNGGQPQFTSGSSFPVRQVSGQSVVRGQDSGYPLYGSGGQNQGGFLPDQNGTTTTQFAPQQGGAPDNGGAANALPPPSSDIPTYFQPQTAPNNNTTLPPNFADIDVMLRETQTGRITFGAAYNSNSGLVGQIIVDERNFDIWGFPRSFREIVDGTAWRGRGQGFRLELVPGNQVQRYLVSFTEPYLFNSQVSFSASGYFFDRRYFDWDEQRLGGRFSFGYRLTPDLSVSLGTRLENVNVHDPRTAGSPSLNAVLGDNSLYVGQVSLINDTRDHPFMASEGSYLEMSYHHGFGDFSYPRGDIDYRRYFLVYQRPDGSGRHIFSVGSRAGFSGSDTPVFENYFAGGFATLRGFDFRGASPVEGGVRVGGQFQWVNTVEYTFPITADDMFKGVLFCDFGTVERDIRLTADNYRVAPGFGFRVHMPVGGAGGAPLAFDFAFPVAQADTDDKQVFSFYMGVLR